jgi:hypothetical protein
MKIDWQAAEAELDAHGHVCLRSVAGAPSRDEASAAFGAELLARLRPIADRWAALLSEPPYPSGCTVRAALDVRQAGDAQALGHDGRGSSRPFPLQATLLLSEPGRDFTGGEIVTVEQRPRMQSRPSVIVPRCGDVVVFAAGVRPVRSMTGANANATANANAKTVYPTRTKHGLSRVRSGQRVALDLVFEYARAR